MDAYRAGQLAAMRHQVSLIKQADDALTKAAKLRGLMRMMRRAMPAVSRAGRAVASRGRGIARGARTAVGRARSAANAGAVRAINRAGRGVRNIRQRATTGARNLYGKARQGVSNAFKPRARPAPVTGPKGEFVPGRMPARSATPTARATRQRMAGRAAPSARPPTPAAAVMISVGCRGTTPRPSARSRMRSTA